MYDEITVKEGQSIFSSLIEALRTKHKRRNAQAADILQRRGSDVVPMLVKEATSTRKRADHRLRILDVIAGIGEPLSAWDCRQVFGLLKHRVPRVQEKAIEVVNILYPGGWPPYVRQALLKARKQPVQVRTLSCMRRVLAMDARNLRRQRYGPSRRRSGPGG